MAKKRYKGVFLTFDDEVIDLIRDLYIRFYGGKSWADFALSKDDDGVNFFTVYFPRFTSGCPFMLELVNELHRQGYEIRVHPESFAMMIYRE